MALPRGLVWAMSTRTYRSHMVPAAGGPEDGSLYGFYTLCGLRIEHPGEWAEAGAGVGDIVCGNCARSRAGRDAVLRIGRG